MKARVHGGHRRPRAIAEETAEKIWELLLPFAGYAFNKAHAVCYAILAYQTAYLKANYPIEYMAACWPFTGRRRTGSRRSSRSAAR